MSNVLPVDDHVCDGLAMAGVLALKAPVARRSRADATIVSLALKVEARDPGTADHCQRLSRYASTSAERSGSARRRSRRWTEAAIFTISGRLASLAPCSRSGAPSRRASERSSSSTQ